MCRNFEQKILFTISVNSLILLFFQSLVDISTKTLLFVHAQKSSLSGIWRNTLPKKDLTCFSTKMSKLNKKNLEKNV